MQPSAFIDDIPTHELWAELRRRVAPDGEKCAYCRVALADIANCTYCGRQWGGEPNDSALTFLVHVWLELQAARDKFPDPAACMVALTEEVGELAKAMLDEPSAAVYLEAVQVATVALRVAVEGDPTLDRIRAQRVPHCSIEIGPPDLVPGMSRSLTCPVGQRSGNHPIGAPGCTCGDKA